MDEETKNRIADYFEAHELVEYLRTISARDIVDAFEDEVEAALEDIEELMEVRRG